MTTVPEDSKTDPVAPSLSTQQSESPRAIRTIPAWAVVFILVALGCAAEAIYMTVQSRQETERLQATLLTMKKQQKQLAMQLDTTMTSLNTVEAHGKSLDDQLNMSLKSQTVQTDDWMLLKARAYLEFAQMNAYWTTNTDATTKLLSQADELLAQIHEPTLFDVRRVIAEEITQVSMIEKIDGAGLLSQLDAAQQLTQQLKIKPIPGQLKNANETAVQPIKKPSVWRLKLQDSMSLLEKLVVVRRVDADIQPLVTPAYAALLRESVQLALQETQLAVLQSNDKLYQLTLKQAIQKINQSFDTQEPNTVALLKQLETLQQHSVVQQKPDLGKALLLLNHVIDSKQEKKSVNPSARHLGAPAS